MKFIAPEVDVLKFNVADVLTTSDSGSEPPVDDDTAALETLVSIYGLPCSGNGSDYTYTNCL